MIASGLESDSLAALATAERDTHPADLRDLFERALRETNQVLPDQPTAGGILKERYARRVACGDWSPRAGAQQIVFLVQLLEQVLTLAPAAGTSVGESLGVAAIVGLYYSLDDIPPADVEAIRATEQAIVEACKRVARGEDANPPGW
jgi:hypothetical protein